MRIGPKYKIARRLGAHIFDKTQTVKFAARAERKNFKRKPRPLTDFAVQMLEKQRIRFSYGINERQFSKYVKNIISKKSAQQADTLYQTLESRLDNIVYRLGLSPSRQGGRQMVSHGHILVNGVRITIPSYKMAPGDILTTRVWSQKSPLFENLAEKLKDRIMPFWVVFDTKKSEAKMLRLPDAKTERPMFDFSRVLEFYKR